MASLRAAAREERLTPLIESLERIVPDITHQYSTFAVESEYERAKVRAMHALQIDLAGRAIARAAQASQPVTVVDIGDSAGTHIAYLQTLYGSEIALECLSINLDPQAVDRIRQRGLKAVRARAEALTESGVTADVFLLFETLEHLANPIGFLHDLARTRCRALVLTVPYVAASRIGLHHIRAQHRAPIGPETVHLFELSPADWKLLFRHAGWDIVDERIYRQYPRRGPLRLLKPYWRWRDFEGFWGAVLTPDDTWSSVYQGWQS